MVRYHQGSTVSQYQVAQLLGEAYARATMMANAMSWFQKSRICPVDWNVSSDADFALADVLTTNKSFNRSKGSENKSNSDSDDQPLAHYVKANGINEPKVEEFSSKPKESTSRHKAEGPTSDASTSKPKAEASTSKYPLPNPKRSHLL